MHTGRKYQEAVLLVVCRIVECANVLGGDMVYPYRRHRRSTNRTRRRGRQRGSPQPTSDALNAHTSSRPRDESGVWFVHRRDPHAAGRTPPNTHQLLCRLGHRLSGRRCHKVVGSILFTVGGDVAVQSVAEGIYRRVREPLPLPPVVTLRKDSSASIVRSWSVAQS